MNGALIGRLQPIKQRKDARERELVVIEAQDGPDGEEAAIQAALAFGLACGG